MDNRQVIACEKCHTINSAEANFCRFCGAPIIKPSAAPVPLVTPAPSVAPSGLSKIKKAVIPAAGLGTRILPASKAIPKEMLPIVDKPAIQYIVEEASAAGITDILIITNRGKEVMEDHFDHAVEIEAALEKNGDFSRLSELQKISSMANIYFIRQKETKGLGHAVLSARSFVGDDPFAVLYGDDVILGEHSAIGEMAMAFEKYQKSVVGVKPVSLDVIGKYCSLKIEKIDDTAMRVLDMVEKPKPYQIMSNYAILGRCILTPEIFDILEKTPYGFAGELQLTDAMAEIARRGEMIGFEYSGKRYDMGSKLGAMIANVEAALAHDEIKDDFKAYLKDLVSTL
jgi:UTP--glucose-1-phosphate uridylyltransferase